jgi:hypothetical protein
MQGYLLSSPAGERVTRSAPTSEYPRTRYAGFTGFPPKPFFAGLTPGRRQAVFLQPSYIGSGARATPDFFQTRPPFLLVLSFLIFLVSFKKKKKKLGRVFTFLFVFSAY